ncbi:unnamed protein product, partial [Prorocentrum cordatum]
ILLKAGRPVCRLLCAHSASGNGIGGAPRPTRRDSRRAAAAMKRWSNESSRTGEPGEAELPAASGDEPQGVKAEAAAEGAAAERYSQRTARAIGCGLSKRRLRAIEESKAFKVVTIVALVFALFGWTFVILLDVPDDPTNLIVDILMTLAFGVFVLELMLR